MGSKFPFWCDVICGWPQITRFYLHFYAFTDDFEKNRPVLEAFWPTNQALTLALNLPGLSYQPVKGKSSTLFCVGISKTQEYKHFVCAQVCNKRKGKRKIKMNISFSVKRYLNEINEDIYTLTYHRNLDTTFCLLLVSSSSCLSHVSPPLRSPTHTSLPHLGWRHEFE